MTGTIKTINKHGTGIIVCADGSRVPFITSQKYNQDNLEVGQKVTFSVRMTNDMAFAQHVMHWRTPSGTASENAPTRANSD
jgi:cold shock CspA family protein